MYDINHWIPAFAGMTVGAIGALCAILNDTVAGITDTLILDEVTLGPKPTIKVSTAARL